MHPVRKILVAVDFSKLTGKVLDAAVIMAEKFSAELNVVFVVENMEPYSWVSIPHISFDLLEDEMLKNAETKIERLVYDTVHDRLPCTTKVLKGIPAAQIISHAKSEGCDLIIMGTHGYRGLEKALLGSVAEQVLKNAPCPVLVVHP